MLDVGCLNCRESAECSSLKSEDAEVDILEMEEVIIVAGMSKEPENLWKAVLLTEGLLALDEAALSGRRTAFCCCCCFARTRALTFSS